MIANQTATPQAPTPAAPFQSASLYVGDLHNDVTESTLFELFNVVGPVASIRVCRDSVTRRSLGYAYVNFHNVQDAERALDTMNFRDIKGRACRIMWSQRDPSLRKSGLGNVFIRNLAPSVDIKGLYDTFSVFGNILSCKIAADETGKSKGYGYVHFETQEAAQEAINKFDGALIEDEEVHVGFFVRRQDRAGQNDWTNLYVKQFPVTWDEATLRAIFEAYGPLSNIAIQAGEEPGKSRGFGFVNYVEHEAAAKALAELNGKTLDNNEGGTFELYVSRAQKKNERTREIKTKLDALNAERVSKYQGMNLYVKNVADTVSDEQFRELFAPFGTITSARIMRENNETKTSKGFGFVCFSSPEEATRAVADLNGKNVDGKPLVVTLHQRKEHRRAHLTATYGPGSNGPGPRGQFVPGMGPQGMPVPPFMGMYVPGQMPGRGPMMFPGFPQGANPMGGRGPAGPRGMPYGAPRPGFPGFPQGGVPPFMQGGLPGQMPGQPRGAPRGAPVQGPAGGRGYPQGAPQGGRGPAGPMGAPQMGGRGFPQGGRGPAMPYGIPGQIPMQMGPPGAMGGPRGPPQGVKFNNNVRNMGGVPQQAFAAPQQQNQQSDFSDILASADPDTQKNLIGERLYPLIRDHQPEQAGKITGMLLEMDNGELLNLIESPEALLAKIDEALNVLRSHN